MMQSSDLVCNVGVGMSESADGSMPDKVRECVLAAAYDELTRWGIDRFSILSLADRHGLDPGVIRQQWGNEERLIFDVFLSTPGAGVPAPDTGSLRTDLLELAAAQATYIQSKSGRRLQIKNIIEHDDLPRTQIRRAIWKAYCDRISIVFDRARQRGELLDSVDALTVLELLFAPINMRALFSGEPVDDDYCRTISELVWCAVTLPDR
jgi:hypothetical protein